MLEVSTRSRLRGKKTSIVAMMSTLSQKLQELPENANEATVCNSFLHFFLESLGFNPFKEICQQFKTGQNNNKVDFAARKTINNDLFIHTQSNPYLILEAKRKDINLAEGSASYKSTVNQLKRDLLSPNCQSVKWGLICNAHHVQLFRKHGKVIHPASQCLEIAPDNIVEITDKLRNKIWNSPPALTVAIYNNKGGVGKTTTTVNLAGVLANIGKKVLVIDFDPQQRDLTTSLGKNGEKNTVLDVLKGVKLNIQENIKPFIHLHKTPKGEKKPFKFDVIPASDTQQSISQSEVELRQYCNPKKLDQVLEPLRARYDYILIDSPPNKNFFSESAIYAADVILIPAKHNNIFSLKNAAVVITQFVPEIQKLKNNGSPVALPIFFNGEKMTEPQKRLADETIINLINVIKKTENFDLLPWFFPKWNPATKNTSIFELPSHAIIAKAAFQCKPAVYCHITAYEYYYQLAKEYFIQ